MRAFRRHTERGGLAASARLPRTATLAPSVAPRRASWGFTEGAPVTDALALVRTLPAACKGLAQVKAASKLGLFSRFESFWVELRGSVLVLLRDDTGWLDARDAEGAEQPIAGVVCVLGCNIVQTRLGKHATIRIRRPDAPGVLWLKLESDDEAVHWEKALSRAAAQRVVGVSDFEFVSPIGKGASGKVFLVRDRANGEKLALKVIDKAKVFENRNAFRHALDERLALELVDGHPFFTRLRYAFQTRCNFYLAIDFYEGGDLYQYLRTHSGRLAEPQARIVSAEVALALDHLHTLGFVYRDLKPENVLLDNEGHVRLADFGLCKMLPRSSGLTSTICGTHTYAAPEMLASRQYGISVDLWAFGTFLYHILRGRTPYEARDLDQVIENMNNRRIRFSSKTSKELVAIIKKLLDWDPETRLGCNSPGMQEIRDDPFFVDVDFRAIFRRDQNPDGLFQYAETQRMRTAAKLVAKREKRSTSGTTSSSKRMGDSGSAGSARDPQSSIVGSADQDFQFVGNTTGNTSPKGESSSGSSCSPDKGIFVENGGRERLVVPEEAGGLSVAGNEAFRGGQGTPRREASTSIWDGMVAAAESDDLRNFDMVEWGKVSVDHDEDDESYGDASLWPISKTRHRLEDERMIAGFSYCSSTKSFPIPPNL